MDQLTTPLLENDNQSNQSFVRRLWNWLTVPTATLRDIGERQAARLAASFLIIITILEAIGGLAAVPQSGWKNSLLSGLGISLFLTLIAYILARTKWYRLGIFIFSLGFSSIAYFTIISQGTTTSSSLQIFIYVPLGLIVGSSFLSPWAVFLLTALNIGALLSIKVFSVNIPFETLGPQAGIITTLGFVLILLANFRNNVEKARLDELREVNTRLEAFSGDLERRVRDRTQELTIATDRANQQAEQLRTVADLSRSFASIRELDILLTKTTQLISERMGYYHVGIFLIDEKQEYAILRASNSEGGMKMIERNHRLLIGSEGIVGFACSRGRARIALDVGTDAVFFSNPDLPSTRSEVALPLKYGETIIGALDIQSNRPTDFTDEDISIFTILADQLAIAIQNSLSIEQEKIAVIQAESATKQLIGRAWDEFTKTASITGYRYDGTNPYPLTESASEMNNERAYSIPLNVRGDTIGNLTIIPSKSNQEWDEDGETIIQSVAERIALAVENTRLLEDAQRRAAKEQLISEIATKISEATETNTIMATTVSELQKRLGALDVTFHLGIDEG